MWCIMLRRLYYTGALYYAKVRWLSQGRVLERLIKLKEQILSFFEEKNEPCAFEDPEYCKDVSFLCDIMAKQNDLNVNLQGNSKTICDMWRHIEVFRTKLKFLKTLLER